MDETSLHKATRVRKEKGNYRAREAVGVVRADEVLTLDAYCKRMGTTRGHVNESRRLRQRTGTASRS